MKLSKIIIPIVLVVILGASWVSFIVTTVRDRNTYDSYLKQAKISVEEGLYQQAVEYYKLSLEIENSEDIYEKIKETYDLFYSEEPIDRVRLLYLEDMELASSEFPKNAMFWETQLRLYFDAEDYSNAYSVVNKALNYGAKSEKLDEYYNTLVRMVRLDFQIYTDFKTALNGYITVCDGDKWYVVNEIGEELTYAYNFVGLINNEGKGLYTNDIDSRLVDEKEIPRARFKITVEDAGYYNEDVDLMPVKIDGKWKYLNSDGEFIGNEYKIAGSFHDGKAVAFTGTNWVLINEKGNETELKGFEDIKLDLYGCHNQNGLIIAKESGKYHLYDSDFDRISDFSADDIDICINDNLIAFKNGNKWGFVDTEGDIVVEPTYSKAKSFANGFAAVCSESNQWGFLNEDFELYIPYAYHDAFYFTENRTCIISQAGGEYQMLSFMFE